MISFRSLRTFALVSAVLCSLACLAAPKRSTLGVKMNAEVDSVQLVMGDQTHLRLTVDVPANLEKNVDLGDLPQLAAGEEAIEWHGVDIVALDSSSTRTPDRIRYNYDYTIQAFDPETIVLPPFTVLSSDHADSAFSNVVTIKVIPVEVDSTMTPMPYKTVAAPAFNLFDFIPTWALWALLAVLLAGGVFAYFQLRKRKIIAIEEAKKPSLPPYELALNELNNLRTSKLAETGQEKEFYTRLTDIIRVYLQGRFGINAMEMSSTDILRALRANPETKGNADTVRDVLSMADFVKFAKVRPLPDDNIRAFNRSVAFVQDTKPAPVVEETTQTNTSK